MTEQSTEEIVLEAVEPEDGVMDFEDHPDEVTDDQALEAEEVESDPDDDFDNGMGSTLADFIDSTEVDGVDVEAHVMGGQQ